MLIKHAASTDQGRVGVRAGDRFAENVDRVRRTESSREMRHRNFSQLLLGKVAALLKCGWRPQYLEVK